MIFFRGRKPRKYAVSGRCGIHLAFHFWILESERWRVGDDMPAIYVTKEKKKMQTMPKRSFRFTLGVSVNGTEFLRLGVSISSIGALVLLYDVLL